MISWKNCGEILRWINQFNKAMTEMISMENWLEKARLNSNSKGSYGSIIDEWQILTDDH